MLRQGSLAALVAAALLLAPAASAVAQNQLYNDYRKDGQVNPCSYSPAEVRKNLRNLPPDVQQYAPGLADQLRRPCAGAPSGGQSKQQAAPAPGASGGPPGTAGARSTPAPPAPKAPPVRSVNGTAPPMPAASDSGIPGGLVIGLGVLAALVLGILLLGRFAGLDLEAFTRPLRASLAEAGGRAGDLLRLRR